MRLQEDYCAKAPPHGDRRMMGDGDSDTFVLEKVAHAGAPRQNQLGDIFDDLRLVFRRESGEPFCKPLLVVRLAHVVPFKSARQHNKRRPTTLPCRESRMRYLSQRQSFPESVYSCAGYAHT